MKYNLLPFLVTGFVLAFHTTSAQSEKSDFTATGRGGVATTFSTDYHAAGINPSNLGWKMKFEEKSFTFGLLETSTILHSEALERKELWNSITNWNSGDLTQQQKNEAAADFASKPLAINQDLMSLGLSFQNETFGGIAFTIHDRISWYSNLNKNAAEIMFLGFNAPYFDKKYNEFNELMSQESYEQYPDSVKAGAASNPGFFSDILDGTRMNMNWYREFNLSYGRKIINGEKLKIYVGAGAKYLQGIATIDIAAEGGEFKAFSAVTPGFGINYGDSIMASNPTTITSESKFPSAVGSGFGADAGITLEFFEKLKIGAALTDIGSITWNGNAYEADDNTLDSISSEGFNSYNIFLESEDILADNKYFQWHGSESRTVSLPALARLGASYKISEKFEVGADVVVPANKVANDLTNTAVSFGIDFRPLDFVTISSGFSTGGNYSSNIPLGVVFNVGDGAWEAGVATRDVMVFITQDKPTISVAMGFLRFRI